jgi:4-carboxymuconolactone decarboxylase
MTEKDPSELLLTSPREAARAFTPELTELVNDPLYSKVWTDERLSPRDRSLVTVASLVSLHRPDELPAHLRRAIDNGVTVTEISALITHLAFYAGFPAAISASVIAQQTLGDDPDAPAAAG